MTWLANGLHWLAARWRQSLVFSLTLIGIAAVVVIALVVSSVVGRQIEQGAVKRARVTAEGLASAAFAPRLPHAGGTLSVAGRRALDGQVAAARASQPGSRVSLRDRTGRVLYRSGARGGGRWLGTTIPVATRRGGEPQAQLRFEIPYGPIARDISGRTRRLNLVLALMAVGVYLLALPTLVRAGRAVRKHYDPRRMEIAGGVKRAIRHHELTLAYQPIVSSSTGRLRSVEALVRWTDPRKGAISPGVFVPAVEETEAMWGLSDHIFELAFSQCARWCGEGREICVAVNLSGAVLLDKRLVPRLCELAKQYRIPPALMELEITEGALVRDPVEATRVLSELTAIGLRVIAIDDFGTGYSSLARLHELPLDTLKIDQSFVMRMAAGGDSAIVRSVIDVAHALGLDVIAEGVEDSATIERLHTLGAEYVQGYAVSRPMPAAEVADWLEQTAPFAEVRSIQAAIPPR